MQTPEFSEEDHNGSIKERFFEELDRLSAHLKDDDIGVIWLAYGTVKEQKLHVAGLGDDNGKSSVLHALKQIVERMEKPDAENP